MSSWNSYCKLWNVGHPNVQTVLRGAVRVEEKVDGSQFSFGMHDGVLRCRSKGCEIDCDAPPKLFQIAVNTAFDLFERGLLPEGYTYRGEAFYGPKHNTLAYDRMPQGGIILFDVAIGHEDYMSRADLEQEAKRLNLEVVPLLYQGVVQDYDQFTALLDTVSVLGGQKIEGVAIKSSQFGADGKPMYAKFVSERFKELNTKDWKERNPAKGDVVQMLKERYRTEARWDKAIQHLKERDELTNSPKDIGALIKEIQADVQAECEAEIKELLFKWVWPDISRGAIAGLPQWYKELLAKQAFADQE